MKIKKTKKMKEDKNNFLLDKDGNPYVEDWPDEINWE